MITALGVISLLYSFTAVKGGGGPLKYFFQKFPPPYYPKNTTSNSSFSGAVDVFVHGIKMKMVLHKDQDTVSDSIQKFPPPYYPKNTTSNSSFSGAVDVFVHGIKMKMVLHKDQDTVSDSIRKTRTPYCHPELLRLFFERHQNAQPCNFLDIGANIGSCSIAAASLGCTVVAFELNPLNSNLVRLSAEANNVVDRIRLIPYGLSDEAKRVPIYFLPYNMGHSMAGEKKDRLRSEYEKTDGQLYRFDDMAESNQSFDFAKLDVEGSELKVLKGGQTFFRNITLRPPLIVTEFFDENLRAMGDSAKDLRNYLKDMGYDCGNAESNNNQDSLCYTTS
jgi:FkbM family methyltransferase